MSALLFVCAALCLCVRDAEKEGEKIGTKFRPLNIGKWNWSLWPEDEDEDDPRKESHTGYRRHKMLVNRRLKPI